MLELKKKLNLFIVAACIALYFIYSSGLEAEYIENLDIPAGVGIDIKKSGGGLTYNVPTSVYIFEPNTQGESRVVSGFGSTIGETRETRNLHEDKKLVFGLQKVYIVSEEYARFGIDNMIELLFKTPTINDMGRLAVFRGKAADLLIYKIKGYESSADFIEGLLSNSRNFDFWGDTYKLINVCIECTSEGRSMVLPYIDLNSNGPYISGIAVFNKCRMLYKLDMAEGKYLNLLKEDDSKGILTIKKNSIEYASLYANSHRKVKCRKEKGKYHFYIDLNIGGDVIENTLYDNMISDKKVKEKFEKDLEQETKKNCTHFIEKMQNTYRLDMLDLGRVAAAKYGRKKGTDWNREVSDSEITVNVKIKASTLGRGDL